MPIFDDEPHHVAITWTSEGGVVEVIIDAILQSRFVDVATNDIIPPQSQFAVGGSLPENKNFVGSLKELNMWDEVLPLEMLYSIAASGGNDVGNVAAWKDVLPHSYTAMRSGGLEILKQRGKQGLRKQEEVEQGAFAPTTPFITPQHAVAIKGELNPKIKFVLKVSYLYVDSYLLVYFCPPRFKL